MIDTLKKAVLGSYVLIDELFTLKVYNKVILNLVQKGVSFSVKEFERHQVIEKASDFVPKNQVESFLTQARMCMIGFSNMGKEESKGNTSFRLVQSGN